MRSLDFQWGVCFPTYGELGSLGYMYIPCKSKDYFLNGFSVKTIVLVGIYNQHFQGTIILMVFDFLGI